MTCMARAGLSKKFADGPLQTLERRHLCCRMQPYFIAVERFGPADGETWSKYMVWSGLAQLRELVSLDRMLCPPVLGAPFGEYWPCVEDEWMSDFFTDIDFVRRATAATPNKRLLGVYRNPPNHIDSIPDDAALFKFLGYDLVEAGSGVSALSNCDGFPLAFDNAELSPIGLIDAHDRAVEINAALRREYPSEIHALCDLWAIFESVE